MCSSRAKKASSVRNRSASWAFDVKITMGRELRSRVVGAFPKLYLAIAGRPLLYYAIARLCAHAAIDRVWVVLSPGDSRFPMYDWKSFAGKLEPLFVGGDSRGATVLNALERLSEQ